MSDKVYVVFRDPYGTTQFHSAHSTAEAAEAMRAALTNPNERAWVTANMSLDTEKPTLAPDPDMEAYKVDFNTNGQNVGVTLVDEYEQYRKYAEEQRVIRQGQYTIVYVWALDFSDAVKVAYGVLFPDEEPEGADNLIIESIPEE